MRVHAAALPLLAGWLGLACNAEGSRRPPGDAGPAGHPVGGVEPRIDASLEAAEDFELEVSSSETSPTVGIARWRVSGLVDSATVGFGRERGSFEYQAPVNLDDDEHRTLLLGMKPETTYYVQVVVDSGGRTRKSDWVSLRTGSLPAGVPSLALSDAEPEALYGGFTLTCTSVGVGALDTPGAEPTQHSFAFAFDRDGEVVWAYDLIGTAVFECSRARMSYDGKSLWVGNMGNVNESGALLRIPLDGGASETFELPGRHHDFAVLPNGHLVLPMQANGGGLTADGSEGPDLLIEFDPDSGKSSELYDESRDFADLLASVGGAHTNFVTYVPEFSAISFSMRYANTIGLVSYPEAELLAVFGGPRSTFPEMDWVVQHGHQVSRDRLLLFNNDGETGSDVLDYEFDLDTRTAKELSRYPSSLRSSILGDVQRLPNGNLYVTYSRFGVIRELASDGRLLREISTEPIGYSEHRRTLYGPPPPFAP